MHNQREVVKVECRLQNVCVAEFGEKLLQSIFCGAVQGFETEMDHHQKDARSGFTGQVTGQIWSALRIKRIGQISLRQMV